MMLVKTILFLALLASCFLVALSVYLLIQRGINERRIRQEEIIRNPEAKIGILESENNKISGRIKTLIICLLFFACIITYFVGKKVENTLLSKVVTLSLEEHNENSFSNKFGIKNIQIEKNKYLYVKIILEDSGKKYIEEHAFDYRGVWQGSDIIECKE